jgi:hypothetical protein
VCQSCVKILIGIVRGVKTGAAALVEWAVQGRVAEPCANVDRGGVQGIHAREWD